MIDLSTYLTHEYIALLRGCEVVIIAAASENNVIGVPPGHPSYLPDSSMPWHLPADLKRFKRLTTGFPVVMGRVTYENLTKPLPDRKNIVVTRQEELRSGFIPCRTLSHALQLECRVDPNGHPYERVFLIGGEPLFREGLHYADRVELTRVHTIIEDEPGVRHFPSLEAHRLGGRPVWKEIITENPETENPEEYDKLAQQPPFTWHTYVRNRKMQVQVR
jgi:dihydrofolate reductase